MTDFEKDILEFADTYIKEEGVKLPPFQKSLLRMVATKKIQYVCTSRNNLGKSILYDILYYYEIYRDSERKYKNNENKKH